jgi:pimeloyl-ACP methyl ester carboxylesterase
VQDGVVPRRVNFLLILGVLLAPQTVARAQNPCQCFPVDVAFVCDGAGNYQIASKQFRAVVAAIHAPLKIETFVWSHGYKKIVPDQTDLQHSRQKGKTLADLVLDYHHLHPSARIHLVGHSAGCMVALSAAEFLPPATLDTIVLLLPSVSTQYDIRPALRSVQGTVQVHYSSHDWLYLGLCTNLVGCADQQRGDASGRVGFQLQVDSPADQALLPRLVQHPWQPSDSLLGNEGGHYGAYQPAYLKARVMPVLLHTSN